MEYQTASFNPIRNFDVPGVALNQLLTNQASLSSMKDLIIGSRRAYLTPEQQASLTEKIKDQYGGDNRVLRTAIGIATNPWVWIGAAISPPAMSQLRKTGSIFSSGRNVAHLTSGSEGSFLEQIHALSGNHLLDGSLLRHAVEADGALRSIAYKTDATVIKDTLAAWYKANPHVLAKLGVKEAPRDINEWLKIVGKMQGVRNPEKLTDKIFHPNYRGEHQELGKTLKTVLNTELQGAHKAQLHLIPHLETSKTLWLKDPAHAAELGIPLKGGKVIEGSVSIPTTAKGGGLSWERLVAENAALEAKGLGGSKHIISEGAPTTRWEEVVRGTDHKVLVSENTSNAVRDIYHLDPMVKAMREALDTRAVMLMGDETAWKLNRFINAKGEKEFIYDKEKLRTLISGLDPANGNSIFNKGLKGETVPKGQLSAEGMDFLRTVAPIDEYHAAAMGLGKIKKTELFEEMIRKTVSNNFKQGTYAPRNTFKDTAEEVAGAVPTIRTNSPISNAETLANLNRLAPNASATRKLHPEDYDVLMALNQKHGGGKKNYDYLVNQKQKVLKEIANHRKEGKESYSYTLDAVTGIKRYMKDTSEIFSRHTPHTIYDPVTKKRVGNTEVWGSLIAADEAIRKGGLPAGGGTPMFGTNGLFNDKTKWRSSDEVANPILGPDSETIALTMTTPLKDIVFKNVKGVPGGAVTLGDLMSHQYQALQNVHAKDMFKEVILPHVSGRATAQSGAMRALQLKTHATVNAFANGALGKTIEGWGNPGKDFIEGLRGMSTYESLSGPLAKGLYVGFLGANMMSVMLNLMQPLLHASMWGGLDIVLPAYKEAFGEMMGYAKARMKLGARITDAKRAELMQENFKHVGDGMMGDLIGVAPDVFANIDGASFAGVESLAKEGMGKFLAMTLPMKLFEKAELMNRLVSAHSVDRMYKRAGIQVGNVKNLKRGESPRPIGGSAWNEEERNLFNRMSDTKRFVQEAQFGGSPLNMPTAFLGAGPVGGLVGNPLGRQFLSFISRSLTSWSTTGKQISPDRFIKSGVPLIGGKRIIGGHLAPDLLRAMGTGAIGYEVFKEIGQVDMSRGLGINPILEVMGGGWKPPIVSIPIDMVRVAMGDLEFAKSSIPGVMPMGIAATRAMGMLPAADQTPFVPDLARHLQKTYVDWNATTPEGQHPVYSGDGRLINYESPFAIVTAGLGINLGTHPKSGEVDGYLAKQREVITQMESDYMNALISNNIPKAKNVQANFEKKFNMPLKISKSQWRSRMRNLETARMERIANTIPSEYKHIYQNTLAEEHKRLGLSKEEVLSSMTSGGRTNEGAQRTSGVKLDPATVAEIKKHLQQQEQQEKPIEEQGFNPYRSWNK